MEIFFEKILDRTSYNVFEKTFLKILFSKVNLGKNLHTFFWKNISWKMIIGEYFERTLGKNCEITFDKKF